MAYALVTGASGGIGLELARLLAGDGYDLVLVARSRTKLEALADDLEAKHGVTTQVMELDLTRPEAPGELVRRLAGRGIEVEILINNAGFGLYGEFATTGWDRNRDMIRL
ncbi:MAG: SDR family NAD(P)-dependent oxidoreductase, partial [Gemmatimonadales bacterium]